MTNDLRQTLEAAVNGETPQRIAETLWDEFEDLGYLLEGFTAADLHKLVESGAVKLTDSNLEDMRSVLRVRREQKPEQPRRQRDRSMDKIDKLIEALSIADRITDKRKH